MAVSTLSDADTTRVLNAFQRDARAALEELLPFLHRPGLYPDVFVDGWGDARAGRGTASTVALVSPKALRPPDRTKELGRVRLEVGDPGEWTAIVSVVAHPDERHAWPPVAEDAWWSAVGETLRTGILEFHGPVRQAKAAARRPSAGNGVRP